MPQGPAHLHKKFGDDSTAFALLGNFTEVGGVIHVPRDFPLTDDQKDALTYLVQEWDYGYTHSTMSDVALALAKYYHFRQKRKNSDLDYVTHPIAVAELLREEWRASYGPNPTQEQIDVLEALLAVAYLHDVVEDCKDKGASFEVLEKKLKAYARTARILEVVIEAIKVLTKKEGEVSYFEYLKKVKLDPLALGVKLKDIKHNKSDLAPGKLRDKYDLAEYYLLN